MRGIAGSIILISVLMTGCANFTPRQVAEPSTITLQEGVADVAEAIAYLQTIPREERAGLLLDEVEVKFNVAANATAKNDAKLTLTNTIPTGGSIGLNAGTELTNSGDRGNVITLKFRNLATVDITKGPFAGGKTLTVQRGPTLSPEEFELRKAQRRLLREKAKVDPEAVRRAQLAEATRVLREEPLPTFDAGLAASRIMQIKRPMDTLSVGQ